MTRRRLPFSELRFGLRDAWREAQRDRDLLLSGYFDLHGAHREVLGGHRWLVLGYKGSGKSALAQHMQLRAATDQALCVRTTRLTELSFAEFASVAPGELEWTSRFPKVWALVIWLQLLDMFRRDATSPSRSDAVFQIPMAALESGRLLPVQDIAEAVRDYAHHPLVVSGFGAEHDTGPAAGRMLALSRLVEQLARTAGAFRGGRRFVLIIDGDDDIFTGDPKLYEVVASLLEATSRINDELSGMPVRAKVVVLCRTDLFSKLPGSNKNKLLGDCGLELNWYEELRDPSRSPLAMLANLKARVADDEIGDIFGEYLPQRMSRGGRPPRRTVQLLLDHTRHTPRDLLSLLTCIGEVAKSRDTGRADWRVPAGTVGRGLSRYSRTYFAREIQDEVWGHLGVDERAAIVPILTAIGRPRFAPDEFANVSETSYPQLNPGHLLEVLYDCGAIGNVREVETGRGTVTRMTVKYRNLDSTLNLSEDVFVHSGWLTKLNILEDRPGGDPRRPTRQER